MASTITQSDDSTATMVVVCTGDTTTWFDREYYATTHLAIAMDCWGQYGLRSAEAFFPAGDGDGWVSIGVYRFGAAADPKRALQSPETERVMADVANFTDSREVLRSMFTPF
jgi:uncharacterized protein (TIGR02118 family)